MMKIESFGNGDQDERVSTTDWSIYHLMIVLALALTAGRISVVTSREGDTAFLSANDRSRWATVASLVERGTYEIDQQISITNPIHRNRRPWNSIDKVKHLGKDGKQHFYSSKPPLLATVVAAIYWAVYQVTGMTLTQQPLYVPRLILILFNLPLLAAFFYSTIATIHQRLTSSWARQVAAASVCFATMVLPFSISLNNHLPACTATAIVMWIFLRGKNNQVLKQVSTSQIPAEPPTDQQIESKQEVNGGKAQGTEGRESVGIKSHLSSGQAFIAGTAATLAAANELPALSMTALWALLFFLKDRTTLLPFACGGLLVASAFFGTNWAAHQSLRPPYAHRGNGELLSSFQSEVTEPNIELQKMIANQLESIGHMERDETSGMKAVVISESDEPQRWTVNLGEIQYGLLREESGWAIHRWDDWYEYEGTYWKDGARQGVDKGEANKTTYLMHLTIGHHGIFSLTPIWVLIPLGWLLGLANRNWTERSFHLAVIVATTVCFLFYLNRPLIDRNYGGVSVCFRWMLWFAPLWLASISPALDRLGRWRIGRFASLTLLAFSFFSVATALQTPWQSPWLYRFWLFLGWIEP